VDVPEVTLVGLQAMDDTPRAGLTVRVAVALLAASVAVTIAV
jgi:hypothetical protein